MLKIRKRKRYSGKQRNKRRKYETHAKPSRHMYIHVPSKKATSDPESEMEGWLIHLPPPYLRLDDFMLAL